MNWTFSHSIELSKLLCNNDSNKDRIINYVNRIPCHNISVQISYCLIELNQWGWMLNTPENAADHAFVTKSILIELINRFGIDCYRRNILDAVFNKKLTRIFANILDFPCVDDNIMIGKHKCPIPCYDDISKLFNEHCLPHLTNPILRVSYNRKMFDFNHVENDGVPCIFRMIKSIDMQTLKYFLAKGLNINVKNKDGELLIDYYLHYMLDSYIFSTKNDIFNVLLLHINTSALVKHEKNKTTLINHTKNRYVINSIFDRELCNLIVQYTSHDVASVVREHYCNFYSWLPII